MDLMQTGPTAATIVITLRVIVVFEFIASISTLFDYKHNLIYSANVRTNITVYFVYAWIFIIVSDIPIISLLDKQERYLTHLAPESCVM